MVKFQLEVKLIGIMRVLELFMKSVILKQKKETLEALNDYIIRNQ